MSTKLTETKYTYLEEITEGVDADGSESGSSGDVVVNATFNAITMGNPQTVHVDGVEAIRSKFCLPGLPKQNVDHIYFIPLYINANTRSMFIDKNFQEGRQPDCVSMDGVQPLQPLNYNGMEITLCNQCPLFGYGQGFSCHNKGVMVGLVYLPTEGDLLIPARKHIPGTSMSNFKGFAQSLLRPVNIDGTWKRLPPWARITKVYTTIKQNKGFTVNAWTFQLFDQTTALPEDMPYAFTPPHLIEKVRSFMDDVRHTITTPQLSTNAPPALANTSATPVPVSEEVVAVEAESSY